VAVSDVFEAKAEIAERKVWKELMRAKKLFPPSFRSPHEGIAVVRGEFEELWDDVKHIPSGILQAYHPELEEEAIQLAAMVLRFIVEICLTEE